MRLKGVHRGVYGTESLGITSAAWTAKHMLVSLQVKHADAPAAPTDASAADGSVPQPPVAAGPADSVLEDAAAAVPEAATAVPEAADEYLGAPAPVCELNRIKHLHDLNILYTPPEQRFDDITKLCTLVFKVGSCNKLAPA